MTGMERLQSATKLIAFLALVSAAAACSPPPPDTPGPASAVSTDSARALLLQAAERSYRYGPERQPLGVPGQGMPEIRVATASPAPGATVKRTERIVARLTSDRGYPRMGIPPGVSYLWRDTSGARPVRHRLLVVPVDRSYPMMWLAVRLTTKQQGDPIEPVFMLTSAFAYQGCDPGCEVDHCTSGDSLHRLTAAEAAAFGTMIQR